MLIIDNFAGGGGATEGIVKAVGRPVDSAINHDPQAIEMHKANHPHTKHFEKNVWTIEPRRVTEGQRVGLGWFSPDCTHFSKAKGGKPVSKKIRALANVVTRWGKETDMSLFILENVEEFQGWGPVSADGLPIAARKGELFKRWWGKLQDQGYNIQMRLITACDYGAPTSRTRLFVIGRKDGLPIYWPDPNYGSEANPYRMAADCIDWSIPCPSIFERAANRRPELVDATLRRIARGVMRYVVNNPRPFIVGIDNRSNGARDVWDSNEPLRTVTLENRFAVAAPRLVKHTEEVTAFLARHYGGHENDGQPMDRAMHTITSRDHHALVTAHIKRDFGQSVGSGISEPIGSITADGGGHAALVASSLVKFKGTSRHGQSVDVPLHTIQANGLHYGEVRAFLIKYYGTYQNPELNRPLGVVTTKDRFGLVTVHGEQYVIADIGMRMLTPRELFRAQGFRDTYIIDPLVPDKRSTKNPKLIPLPKTAQVRMCGNSVCPDVAEALVRANYVEPRMEAAA